MMRPLIAAALAALFIPALAQAQLTTVSTVPALNAVAPVSSAVSVTFDKAVDTATVDADSFRVYGRFSGSGHGTFSFSNGNKTVTLTPTRPFSAGETVYVNLSHDLKAADTSSLRAQGYAYQFWTAVVASAATFREIASFSNTNGPHTQIYEAAAADLDSDGYLDLATVNEESADVRVFMNRADGSGLFGSMLPREQIGVEASPNEPADFNNDGKPDLVVCAAESNAIWVLLGAGNGTFPTKQEIAVSGEPHGNAVLDADGDGDIDIVAANVAANRLELSLNDGSGHFGPVTSFEGSVNAEYGLVAADINSDGITDLVVGGRDPGEIATMLGNGNGTFTLAGAAQTSGGWTWVIDVADLNADGKLDIAAANDGTGNVGVLLGDGAGNFAAPTVINVGSHLPSVVLGDLDGDGDFDMVVSSYGGGFWRWYRNDGAGNFTNVEDFAAADNPSCAVLFDADNDGDLDLALFDEIADVVKIRENSPPTTCSPAPSSCRSPLAAGKAKLQLSNAGLTEQSFTWGWNNGAATTLPELGNPLTTNGFELCLYEDGTLINNLRLPQGENCPTHACWKASAKGFSYKDREGTPDAISKTKIQAGDDGKAKISVKGRGERLALPDVGTLSGVLDVQLQKTTGGVCWGATYSPPFQTQDAASLRAISD